VNIGEDALANLSFEITEVGVQNIMGHVRIRSKMQGIALSLGDRITSHLKTMASLLFDSVSIRAGTVG